MMPGVGQRYFPRNRSSIYPGSEVVTPDQIEDVSHEMTAEEREKTEEVIALVDAQIADRTYGRLFACLYFDGKQRKVAPGDLLMLNSDLGVDVGTRITLDKVTLVGGRDFTLLGRPLLPRDLVRVEATVVEKNLSKTKVTLYTKRKIRRAITHRE